MNKLGPRENNEETEVNAFNADETEDKTVPVFVA